MTAFLWNLFLAFVWATARGTITLENLLVGFALGYAALWLGRDVLGAESYVTTLPRLIEFIGFFAVELVLANLRVAYDVITPQHHMRPGIIALPLDAETDGEILFLANVIALTPGTLVLDVSDDRKTLYIHSMYIDSVEEEKRKLKDGFERRVLRLLR